MFTEGPSGPIEVVTRDLLVSDRTFHKEMIYISLWDAPDQPRRPRSVLEHPKIKNYYEDWGRPNDVGIVAAIDGLPVGMVQCRVKECVTEQYANYPELGIAVLPDYHSIGIGGRLMGELLERIQSTQNGIRLGVNPENSVAIKLYQKFGFEFYAQPEGQYPQMVLHFS